MNNSRLFRLFVLITIGVTVTLSACNDDDNSEPVSTNKTTGFILSVATSTGNLVKYFETLPTGTANVSDGFDFVAFNPQDIFNSAIYLQNPNVENNSREGGLAKLVVDENGDFQIVDEITTTGRVNPIEIRDAETGIYFDFGIEERIIVFNPSDMSRIGTINMSDALYPRDEETRYRDFFVRDNLVFTPLASTEFTWYDPFVVHIADIDAGTFVGDFTLDLGGPVRNNNFFAGLNEDEDGNLYLTEEGDLLTGTPARLHRVNSGSMEVDLEFELDLAGILNPQNLFYRVYNSFFYIGNGEALVSVTSETPAGVLAILATVEFNPGRLSTEQRFEIEAILNESESALWCVLDLDARTVTAIDDVPGQTAQGRRYTVTEFDGKWYLPVDNDSENAYYSYDPTTGTAEKAFDVTGGRLSDFINLANNN